MPNDVWLNCGCFLAANRHPEILSRRHDRRMSAHAMAMQGRHGKIDVTLLRRGDLLRATSARILLGNIHGRADAPWPFELLRIRSKRQRGRATEKPNELAPP